MSLLTSDKGAKIGFQDGVFLPSRAGIHTTFLLNCFRDESLETVTCLD